MRKEMMTMNPWKALLAAILLGLLAAGCSQTKVKRYGWAIGLKPEMMDEYKALHADCWPGVLKMIEECNIRNYSIYLGELEKGKYYLFSYLEYVGDDFEADMKRMAADETTRKWWKRTDPCQIPLATRREGEFWMDMEEVFHTD
jgi:L-rhamnose mutarotase